MTCSGARILGVPVLTNSAIDSQSILDDYRKEKNKIAQSNAQTQKIATQMEGLEAEKREQTADLERLQGELAGEYEERARLEGDLQQSEHVKTLLDRMDSLEADIAGKKASRDALVSQIVVQTKEAWRGLVSARVEAILAEVGGRIQQLEEKEAEHTVEARFFEDMKAAAHQHHCQLCDQDLDEARVQMLLEKVATYTRGSGALSVDEATELQRLRVRKATLESMRSGGNMELLSLLEGQLDSLAVEIDDSERQLRAVREELERHGDVEELAKSSRDAVTALAQCLKKIENLKEGIQAVKNKLKEIDGALATLEDKMNRVSTDADMLLAGRKVSMCEQIHDIFESGIAAYRDKLKTDVERDATELFVGISNDPDYIQLKINDNYGLSIFKYCLIKFLRCSQYIGIIKISGTGVEHAAPQDGLHFFRHDSFDVICPQLVGFFVIENLREVVLYCMRRDGIASGHIDTQRSNNCVKPCVQHNPVSAVYVIFADG